MGKHVVTMSFQIIIILDSLKYEHNEIMSTFNFPSIATAQMKHEYSVLTELQNCVRSEMIQTGNFIVYWLYGIHTPIIVQCQNGGCSRTRKDSVVVWDLFRPVATICLTSYPV